MTDSHWVGAETWCRDSSIETTPSWSARSARSSTIRLTEWRTGYYTFVPIRQEPQAPGNR